MARQFNPFSFEIYHKVGSPVLSQSASTQGSQTAEVAHRRSESESSHPTKPRVVAPVNFAKQTPRPPIPNEFDAHPMRFVSVKTPHTRRRISAPDIGSISPRKDSTLKAKDNLDLNFKHVWKKEPYCVVPFDKQAERPPFNGRHPHVSQNAPFRLPGLKCIDPDNHGPTAGIRPYHSVVPVYLNKVGHRYAIQMLSYKMIQMNAYSGTEFSSHRTQPKPVPFKGRAQRLIKNLVRDKQIKIDD